MKDVSPFLRRARVDDQDLQESLKQQLDSVGPDGSGITPGAPRTITGGLGFRVPVVLPFAGSGRSSSWMAHPPEAHPRAVKGRERKGDALR